MSCAAARSTRRHPSGIQADVAGSDVGSHVAAATRAWVVLAVWAVVSPALAATFFRWE
jgi:hypothetical protein